MNTTKLSSNACISIIIPVYNAEDTIKRAVESCLNQTYKNIEIICVNDGSKDNSLNLLKELEAKDLRVKIINQANRGPSRARYNAIKEATGEYLMFLDADDWYEPNMVKSMVKALENNNTDFAICDNNIIEIGNLGSLNKVIKNHCSLSFSGYKNVSHKDFNRSINNTLWNKIFKTEILKQNNIQYPTGLLQYDDKIFILKYLCCIKNCYALTEKLYNYVIGNPNSLMGKVFTNKNKRHEFDFLFCFADFFEWAKRQNLQEEMVLYVINNQFWASIPFWYKKLSKINKYKMYKHIKNFIEKYKILSESENFKNIQQCKNFFEFNNYLDPASKINIPELILSFKNSKDRRHKIITILGIKIKYPRGGGVK